MGFSIDVALRLKRPKSLHGRGQRAGERVTMGDMSDLKRRELMALGVPVVLGATAEAEAAPLVPETQLLKDTGAFPNSRLPALVYRGVLAADQDLAPSFEALFEKNGWTGSWRNGLYRTHHYHSTAHEVLGVYLGHVKLLLGG